jgi:hypothetical protein
MIKMENEKSLTVGFFQSGFWVKSDQIFIKTDPYKSIYNSLLMAQEKFIATQFTRSTIFI